jgi:hypothetical protein
MADMALYVAKRGGAMPGPRSGARRQAGIMDFAMRADPEKALAMEWVAIGGNWPMNWSGAAGGGPGRPGPSQGSTATQGRKSA